MPTEPGRPRLGIVALNPIQYHAPLHRKIAHRGQVELDVLFLSDAGLRPAADPGFGVPVAWDIELLDGYRHSFLSTAGTPTSPHHQARSMLRWLEGHDAIVINGYNNRWMLLAMTACRMRGIPYLLRASSHPQGLSGGTRRHGRQMFTRLVVAGSAAGLAMGRLNYDFYRQARARSVIFAPNSVDGERFAVPPLLSRAELLGRWGLPSGRPVIVFSGKLISRKRPLDLVAALRRLPCDATAFFVGDGALAAQVSSALPAGRGVVTGFINQSDLPSYYHAADILVLPSEAETWGLVVNEAMACGVLPVVSDRVGCALDLAAGVGEVYPCGDVARLTDALMRAIGRLVDPGLRGTMQRHVERYSLDRTAAGFEQAVLAVTGHSSRVITVEA